MFKDTKEYLAEQPDLLEFLAGIPEIRDFVKKKQETDYVTTLIRKIPNDLMEGYYMAERFDDPREQLLRDWIRNNFNGVDFHYTLKHLFPDNYGCKI